MTRFYQYLISGLILFLFTLTGVFVLLEKEGSLANQATTLSDTELKTDHLKLEKTVSPELISQLVAQNRVNEASGTELNDEAAEAFYSNLPGSLSDAPKPAALAVDPEGNLILDKRVQRVIEFYLMAMGEEPIESIIARIKHDMNSQLDSMAYGQGVSFLENYLQYRNNIGDIKNQFADRVSEGGPDISVIREIKQAIRDSRSEFFSGDVIESLYSGEDEYDDYMMSKAEILNDRSLSLEEKNAELALLNQNTSDELIQSQNQANQLSQVRHSVNDLREQGASDDEINLYREQQLGSDVAERLRALDEKRNAWKTRVDDYRLALADIESMDSYSSEQKMHMVEALRSEHFDEREVLRIRVLDRMK